MSITILPLISGKKEPSQEQCWPEHLVRQKKSGLSMTDYCRQHQLNYDRFYYWVRKERRPAPQLIPIEIKPVQPITKSVAAIAIMPTVLCTLTFRSGSILQIHDKATLPLIISASS